MGWLPGSGCVLWLQMDERQGNRVYDLSEYQNHGTRYGAQWGRGRIGFALDFDGIDDYVEVPHSASLNITDAITIIAWIRADVAHKGGEGVVSKRVWNENYAYSFGRDWSRIIFTFGNGTAYFEIFTAALSWDTARLYMIAVTYDRTNVIIYRDDTVVKTEAHTDIIATNTRSVVIGKHQIAANWFDGTIDEVCIYNRALSPREIQSRYWYGIIPSLRPQPAGVR